MENKFIHLSIKSEYSLTEGYCRIFSKSKDKPSPVLEYMIKNNFKAFAITDYNNLYGSYILYKQVFEYNKNKDEKDKIKLILGCEFNIVDDMTKTLNSQDTSLNHLTLIAKNQEGYTNLIKLSSFSYDVTHGDTPRLDLEKIKRYSKDLICLSSGSNGLIFKLISEDRYNEAKKYALLLKEIFKEDFYIEIHDHYTQIERKNNPKIIKLANEIGVELVATNDARYIDKEDAKAYDVLLCIRDNETINTPIQNRYSLENDNYYLKSEEEMLNLFSYIPKALENTVKIAEQCSIKIEKMPLFPGYIPDNGMTPEEYLKYLTKKGLLKRYEKITKEIEERVEYELNVVISMGFAEYYLIVWDFINYAKSNGIPVGPGRGSGVGSIVAYAIGITDVDPLKYSLIFDRFLNPERVSNPDFDIDFCTEGRSKVIEYVVQKYGAEKVCQIITFGTLAPKNVFKNVAKVYGIPFSESNRISAFISRDTHSIKDCIDINSPVYSKELSSLYEENDTYQSIIDISIKLEGLPKNTSKHAAGVVICREIIHDFVPTQKNEEDTTTQYTKEEVEELGMLKMDFLGLITLTDIDKTIKYIKETENIDIDFHKMEYNDLKVYDLISSGDTDAVFQLESPGMKRFMQNLKPDCIEDIIAGVSLFRPGPMDSIDQFIFNKKHPEKVKFLDKRLKPILDNTYGCIVYQEQVMQIFRDLAGYSYGSADIVRRIMSKKKPELLEIEKVKYFNGSPATKIVYNSDGSVKEPALPAIEGCLKRGVDKEIAEKIFGEMESFAKYAFNKSHAAAYAHLSYQTAYLKTYYLVEFLVAILNNRNDKFDEVAKYINYAREKNIKILLPDINKSFSDFKVERDLNGNKCIRYGFLSIKGLGLNAIEMIEEERRLNGEYKDFKDFISRSKKEVLNKRAIEALILCGAFDYMLDKNGKTKYNRATLMNVYQKIIAQAMLDISLKQQRQLTIFDIEGLECDNVFDIEIEKIPEYSEIKKLSLEKSVASIYLSGHPLDNLREQISNSKFNFKIYNEINKTLEEDLKNEEEISSENEYEKNSYKLEDLLSQKSKEYIKKYNKRDFDFLAIIEDKPIKKRTKSNKNFYILPVSDIYGYNELLIFENEIDQEVIAKENIVKIVIRVDFVESKKSFQLMVKSIKKVDLKNLEQNKNNEQKNDQDFEIKKNKTLWINANNMSVDFIDYIASTLGSYQGNDKLVFFIKDKTTKKANKISYKGLIDAEEPKILDFLNSSSIIYKIEEK